MENDKENTRFQKDTGPLDDVQDDVYGVIAEVFRWFYIDGLKSELRRWLRMALINDQSAYAEGLSREDVIDFCQEFLKLMEALNLINSQKPRKETSAVIGSFCKTFTQSYAGDELWDMFDSVVFYERQNLKSAKDPMSAYRCFAALIDAAYALNRHT